MWLRVKFRSLAGGVSGCSQTDSTGFFMGVCVGKTLQKHKHRKYKTI